MDKSLNLIEGQPLAEVAATIAQAFDDAALFFGHGTDNAADESIWLICSALGIGYAESNWQERLQAALERPATGDEIKTIGALADARIVTRKPLAYLIGEAWFAGLRFDIDESVLVPRSPIATLITEGFAPWMQQPLKAKVLDLCTGSGCIGIATAMYFPDWQVDLSDISQEALNIARLNVAAYDLTERVRVIESDVLESPLLSTYDLIVTNPPYVDQVEMDARPDEFRREPELGLAAGADGLDIVRDILASAAECLNPLGVLICEVGASEPALQAAYPEVPFTWLTIYDDSQGIFVIDRETLIQFDAVFQARRSRT
ncbi:MAG: 50S ribosomal protein L3 N(5)-glutamine methyltransferase [Pseudomonadota bacterium]